MRWYTRCELSRLFEISVFQELSLFGRYAIAWNFMPSKHGDLVGVPVP